MVHRVTLVLAALTLSAALACADPSVEVREAPGGVRVTLTGDWAQSWYTVWRAGSMSGAYDPIVAQATLCTGDCYAVDRDATAGRTYWYRFDIVRQDGVVASYGPFAVRIPDHPLGIRLSPNPGVGATRVELSLPGSSRDPAVPVRALLFDLQGRLLRTLHEGMLPRGVTTLQWDGRDASGRTLGGGLYFVNLSSPLGSATTRVFRVR